MSDEELLMTVLAELRATRFPPELIDKVRILSEKLQETLTKQTAITNDLRELLSAVHDDHQWLRKHVSELNRLLSSIVAHDPPKDGE